jgi:hypothetical protein
MNSQPWLEKAERLRHALARLRDTQAFNGNAAADEPAAIERVAIAHWLRQEFSDEPPEDTRTGLLFDLHP